MAVFDGIIFDMDGTLTVPFLDFNQIRREIGIPKTEPVWEAIVAMSPEQRQRAEEILLQHELRASRDCELQPGAEELFIELAKRGTKVAVLTRNCRAAWQTLRQRFNFPVEMVYTREDGPMKPDPTPVFVLSEQMKVPLTKILCVGDYLFDIQAGKAAGTKTALLVNNGKIPLFANEADYVIHQLLDLLAIVDGIC